MAPYALPASGQQPGFPAMPASPAEWRYHAPGLSWWQRHRRTLQALALVTLLALSGLLILALVREQTGTQGLLVGLGLALFPVPLLIAAFRWLDGVRPTPWRSHAFAFAWGACAATLVALLANSFASDWLTTSLAEDSPDQADTLSAAAVAPVIEEIAKSAAILLLFLYRRQQFTGVISGVVIAGITAAGFAFTENVLYLGTAYDEDAVSTGSSGPSTTAATFFIRIVVSPFAHPLFTALVGVAFGIVAALPRLRRAQRIGIPLLGLLTAVLLHAIWNGAASFANLTFLAVYGFFMLPVFAALTWLAIWARQDGLRTVREILPAYADAGWFAPPEPSALGSMRARTIARNTARRFHGPQAARTVAEYQHFATSLAQLRASAELAPPGPDFAAREQELLHHLWQRRPLAGPPTTSAALSLAPRTPHAPHLWGATPHGPPTGPSPYTAGNGPTMYGSTMYGSTAYGPATYGPAAYGPAAYEPGNGYGQGYGHGPWSWHQNGTGPPGQLSPPGQPSPPGQLSHPPSAQGREPDARGRGQEVQGQESDVQGRGQDVQEQQPDVHGQQAETREQPDVRERQPDVRPPDTHGQESDAQPDAQWDTHGQQSNDREREPDAHVREADTHGQEQDAGAHEPGAHEPGAHETDVHEPPGVHDTGAHEPGVQQHEAGAREQHEADDREQHETGDREQEASAQGQESDADGQEPGAQSSQSSAD